MSIEFLSSPSWLALAGVAYFICAVPFGLVITKYFLGYDVRERGSHNVGMTNVMRTGGKLPGIFTFLLDFSKGLTFVFLARYYFPEHGIESEAAIAFICVFAHTKSIYLKFSGGKGVATNFGVWLALDWRIAVLAMILWLSVYKATKISSIGGLSAIVAIMAASLVLHGLGALFTLSLLLGLYIIWLHRTNIKRILNGEELSMKR